MAGSDNESDDASVHSEATIAQQQQNIQPQIITTVSNNNAKFPYLKKDEYEVWAMKMEYWITNNDMNIWKVIQNGNSLKRTGRDRDGRVIILPPTTADEHIAVQRESKARTTLLQSIPDDHVADFHYMDDARDIWNAVKARFGGNAESKKMRKSMLKQEFSEFRISEAEGLHKGYDRMQKILSQLNQLKAKPEDEDINLKFLRALPSSWSQVALTLKTKGGLELLSFDDLYYKLKTLEVDIKGYSTFSSSQSAGPSHSAFVSTTSASKKMSYADSPSYSSSTYTAPSNSKTGSHRSGNVIEDVLQSFVADTEPEQQLAYEDFEQIEKMDLEEMDLKWQMAMLSVRVHKFEQKAGRKIDFDKKESARFNKKKVRCYKCLQRGHFARECRAKGGNDKQRYSSFKIQEIGKKEEDSKALITVDTLVDWTEHDGQSDGVIAPKEFGMIAGCDTEDAIEEGAAKIYNLITGADTKEASTAGDAGEFALMGVTSEVHNCPFGCDNKYNELQKQHNELNEQNSEYFIQVQAYKNSLKTLEKQKRVLQKNQLTLEDKIRVLSIELENTTNLLKHSERINAIAETAKKELQTKLDNHLVQIEKWRTSSKNLFRLIDSSMSVRTKVGLGFNNYIRENELGWDDSAFSVFTTNSEEVEGRPHFNRFAKTDSMKAVPPPLSGDYTPLSDHTDLDESQMSYGTKSSTSGDSNSVSNDFVSCDNSDKSSEVNSNDFASSDSSVKSSEPKSNDSTSCASTSSISTSESEADFRLRSNVGNYQETINVRILPSFSCNSSDKNGNTSRTSCNKNGYFNKKAGHFRKNASSVSKLCFVCGSSTHLIKDCDFYEKQMANKTVGNGVGPVHSRNNVNHQNQFVPQVVLLRTGKVNITPARPNSSTVCLSACTSSYWRLVAIETNQNSTLDFEMSTNVMELQTIQLVSSISPHDESMVLLRVPRKHNLYTINLNNLSPKGNLACLVAKASVDESVQWHMRMGHVNYKNINRLEEERLGWEAAQRLQAQELADLEKQRAESLMKDANLARQMAQDFEMTEDKRKRQQEVLASTTNYSDAVWDIILARLQANPDLSSIIFGVDFTDDSAMSTTSSKKHKTGDVEVDIEAPSHGVSQEVEVEAPSQDVSREEVDAPFHSQNIPEAQAEVPYQEATVEDVAKAQQTASSLKKVGTKKKLLGRKGVHTSQSTIPTKEGDPNTEHKLCIKYASDEDSASDCDTPVHLYAVVDWELLPTGLGSINAIYKLDNSRKYFTSLREILHLVTRVDLMTIYGRVMTFYQDKKAEGVGLVLWGDLQILMDSPEVNDGSDFWKNQHTWSIQSWKLYSFSGVHVLEIDARSSAGDLSQNSGVINSPCYHNKELASPEQTATAEVVPKSVAGSSFPAASSTLLPFDVQSLEGVCMKKYRYVQKFNVFKSRLKQIGCCRKVHILILKFQVDVLSENWKLT
ncbi:ribonuclease H-like domain-containing protein [Tanacetum coccineum]